MFDLIVRGGEVLDGTGAAPQRPDVGVRDGVIVTLEPSLDADVAVVIDATDRVVTPGFVDVHSHYDGQATWDEVLEPSTPHGVTTLITGNCGVGFAPVRPEGHRVLIELMERGFVSALATNGASIIHDFEVAIAGATSEDVDEALGPGTFGMADETGRLLNGAINDGVAAGLGIGQAVARYLASKQPQFAKQSVLAAAARLDIPVTVHVAIGTDIIHMHPAASGAAPRS